MKRVKRTLFDDGIFKVHKIFNHLEWQQEKRKHLFILGFILLYWPVFEHISNSREKFL